MTLTMGSLFDGIGGFPLAAVRNGQTVLEKRYLCFQSWEQIAVEMGYDLRWLYRIHGKALEEVKAILGIE